MSKIKVLNLYAGIGGNRKLWKNVEVVAVENNSKIAEVYQKFFPKDKVVIADAHEYLLEHYKEFDFIWSSPPCPTHSRTNIFLNAQGIIRYPDMKLYEEIVFLKHWFKGKWIVENVISYYEPLVKPVLLGRHYFWANFFIPIQKEKDFVSPFNIANARATTRRPSKDDLINLRKWHGFNLEGVKNENLLLRNCVYPPLGKYVFDCAFSKKQTSLFEKKGRVVVGAKKK